MKLRSSGLRTAVIFALIAALSGVAAAAPVPTLPLALLASFDEALALVDEAVEQRMDELERVEPRKPWPVAELLARIERDVWAACDDATVALGNAFGTAELTPERRAAVRALIDRQLVDARRARDTSDDASVRFEYIVTCMHLRAIRWMV
jgi:hypothetical protein